MNRVRLQPTLNELCEGDPHLPDLLRYVEHLAGADDPEQAARNVSLAYFALVRGLTNKGLMQMQWAPRLVIETHHTEYEVSPLPSR